MTLPKVLVVGAGGRLGCPLLAVLAASGFPAHGADLDESAVAAINRGVPPERVNEPGLAELLAEHRPTATVDVEEGATGADVAFLVVPTPSGPDDRFDASMVHAAIAEVARGFERRSHLQDADWHPVIVLTSTVMPGECERLIHEVHCVTGWHEGDEYSLVASPEFIALGSVVHDLMSPDVVYLGCSNDRGAALVGEIYARVCPNAPQIRLSLIDAEIAKISLNTYLGLKISYANTVARICESFDGANAGAVLEAVGADGRVGPRFLSPGGWNGGTCLPRDQRAFATLSGSSAVARLRAFTSEADAEAIEWVHDTVAKVAKDDDPIAVLGISYKPDTPVTVDSFGWAVAEQLAADGRFVAVHDPLAFGIPHGCHLLPSFVDVLECPVLVVATAHECYRGLDAMRGQAILDVWNVCSGGGDGDVIRPGVPRNP